jgi:MauM/NapG family ferredoxin protein
MVSLSTWRRISQMVFLALFILFFYMTQYPLDFSQKNIFLRASPLVMVINILITHAFSWRVLPALILLVATLFLGRFFCGWICPVGTFSDLIPKTKRKLSSFYRVKYYFLVFLLVISLFGFNLLVISDPLVIFTRALTFITQVRVPVMLVCIGVLVVVLGERFWCRVLCPLGALLGVFSLAKVLNIHIQETCTRCNMCNTVCPMGAIQDYTVKKSECTLCFVCVETCPRNALTVTRKKEPLTFESRRTFLKTGVAAGAGIILSPLLGRASGNTDTQVIRPPGALQEEDFLSVCVRCGECMRVCPSQGLRPVLLDGSLYSVLTPKLIPRIGECQVCMLCWQVCPTGALVEVDPSQMKIGTASVNRDTCLEWRHGQACLVCQEVCPFQAVDVVESGGQGQGNGRGKGRGRRGPKVNRSLCAGCGACENKCPVEPASITVSPEGEIRY